MSGSLGKPLGVMDELPLAQAVGNDVVDLEDPAIAEHHRRERFVARVCAPRERARVGSSLDLWALFAAKEAAYKALVKLDHSPGFRHREILVSGDRRSVSWRGHVLAAAVTVGDGYVHAIAWSPGPHRPHARVARAWIPEGEAARALLTAIVADVTRREEADYHVVRDPLPGGWDGFGPPRIEFRGIATDIDVSMSHDGRFVAAAALLGPDPQPSSPTHVDVPTFRQ